MRAALIETLTELADADERVFLLTADLGWSVVEPFAERFPDRFLNVGVAEANMAGVAAGLALTGLVPFVYSIATFSSMRCYEQVRNGAVLHRLPVRVVGIGGGFAYGHAGPTHHALEDLALARVQPGMTTIAPGDPDQTRAVVRACLDMPGPVYLRIGKGGNPSLPGLDGRFALDRPELLRPGGDLLLLATGGIAHEALKAADLLEPGGISAAVALMAHLPLTAGPVLIELLGEYPFVVTVEEGFVTGGLGSLVAESIARHGLRCRLLTAGVRRSFSPVGGSEAYLRRRHGLDAESLAELTRSALPEAVAA
jgi:transketolase